MDESGIMVEMETDKVFLGTKYHLHHQPSNTYIRLCHTHHVKREFGRPFHGAYVFEVPSIRLFQKDAHQFVRQIVAVIREIEALQ